MGRPRFLLALAALALAGCGAAPVIPVDPTRAPDSARPAPAMAPAPLPREPDGTVTIRVDESRAYQVIEGFGATITEHFDPATREDLMGALRPRVAEAVFGQIGITMGHLDVGPYENFDAARYRTANDDDDPFTTNWAAFNFVRSDGQKAGIVDLARPYGFDNFAIHSGTNVRWSDPWMEAVRSADYRRYLDEMAESVVVPLMYWRDRFGIVPRRWHHLFNEPTTGNAELSTRNVQEVVDLVKVVGARLRREGFGHLKLAVASEETEEDSLATARAVLADPEARAYVGAITYHTYPYGSVYSEVANILATSGQGRPDERRIRVRNALGNLAHQYGLQVWMTEVSHGRAGTFDSLRGRAIHIHDELRYAYASSYWPMFQAWDERAKRGECDEDCLVHFNRERATVRISGTGYAIGHYARWVRRGAVRVGAESDDARVLVSAFREEGGRPLALVLINNHPQPVTTVIRARGTLQSGEQSSRAGYWLALDAAASTHEDGVIRMHLPAHSVTSIAVAPR